MEIRESNFFYGYTVVTAHYMKEIGKNDQKLLIQLPQENNWHLLSGSCGKSVIFPHLVGFHSSRQNIY